MVPRKTLLPLFIAACFSNGAMAQENARFVHGSYVNVRENAAPDSAVIDHVTTNTPVEVLAQADKRCQIRYGADKTGFVPCNLLGNRKLTLAEVGREWFYDPVKKENVFDPAFSPPRAFWIAPSYLMLSQAGDYFEKKLLSPKQYNLEQGENENGSFRQYDYDRDPAPKLVRYPVSEFEEMKTWMAHGIIASPEVVDWKWKSCRELDEESRKIEPDPYPFAPIPDYWNEDGNNPYWVFPQGYIYPISYPGIKRCEEEGMNLLPKIQPSFFKEAKSVLPGNPYIETISAHFGVKEYGKVLNGPKWLWVRHEGPRYIGTWDIFEYELEIKTPIFEHVIGANGNVGVYQWFPKTTLSPDTGCIDYDSIAVKRNGTKLLDGYAAVSKSLFWFQSPTPLPFHQAKISKRTIRDDLIAYTIDLDSDGISDFVKLSSELGEEYGVYGMGIIFINLNGEWHFFWKDPAGTCD
ncbi:MAG: SH3 domain-containing protein [Zoogloeaceae bacterium]|jgi:hypothetical protein|nr:SH3 domain-containing protein [Zoogloeaceae bacterium]